MSQNHTYKGRSVKGGRPEWTYAAPPDAVILERWLRLVVLQRRSMADFPVMEQIHDEWSSSRRHHALDYLIDNDILNMDIITRLLYHLVDVLDAGDIQWTDDMIGELPEWLRETARAMLADQQAGVEPRRVVASAD